MTGHVFSEERARSVRRRRQNFKDVCSRARNTRGSLIITAGVPLFLRRARAHACDSPLFFFFSFPRYIQNCPPGVRYEASRPTNTSLSFSILLSFFNNSYSITFLSSLTRYVQSILHMAQSYLPGKIFSY